MFTKIEIILQRSSSVEKIFSLESVKNDMYIYLLRYAYLLISMFTKIQRILQGSSNVEKIF